MELRCQVRKTDEGLPLVSLLCVWNKGLTEIDEYRRGAHIQFL